MRIRTMVMAALAAVLGLGLLGIAAPANAAPGNGANDETGVYTQYEPTGAESDNGNDKGKAKGRPAAGAVGKADTKNPPGQQPDAPAGSDPNAGYECDTNKGVAKGNPAHSPCGEGEGEGDGEGEGEGEGEGGTPPGSE